jgi:polyisoprenoid-binding protein YceI
MYLARHSVQTLQMAEARQHLFRDAPFEKINGLVNGLDATVMINISNITEKPMGKVKVPINNIKTGIELRDEHLRSEMWLNSCKASLCRISIDRH